MLQILSSIGTVISVSVIIKEQNYNEYFQKINNVITQNHNFDMNLDPNTIRLVAGIVCVILSLAVIFSILLLVGIKKVKKRHIFYCLLMTSFPNF